MARGDVHYFRAFLKKSKAGTVFSLGSDTLKLGIVGNGVVPTVLTPDPRWGSGGTTDFSAQQVATGTSYTGPITLTSVTYTQNNNVDTLSSANVALAPDAAGFNTAYYAIIYDDTVAGKFAIGFVDLGGPVSIATNAMNLNWNAAGMLTETVN